MAEERIGYEEFFDKELFKPVIESLQTLLESFQELEKSLKTNTKQALEDLKGRLSQIKTASDVSAQAIRDVAKASAEVSKSAEALKNLEKTKERLEKRLNELNAALSDQSNALAKLRAQLKVANNELKDRIKQIQVELKLEEAKNRALRNSFVTYDELSETLEILRTRVKDLMASNQENTEEFKNLSELVKQLDSRIKAIDTSLGQFQRLVGSYKESILEAFSNISAEAVGVSTNLGKITVSLINIVTNTYKAQGGIKGFASAISFLGKALKSASIILALEALVELLSRLRENFFPSAAEKEVKALLQAQISLSEARLRLLEQMNEQQAKLIDLQGDDLTTQLERLKVQEKLVELQLLEAEAQKTNLEVQRDILAESVSQLSKAENQIGLFGRAIAKVFEFVANIFSKIGLGGIADDIRAAAKSTLDFLARTIGSQKELDDKRAELLATEEKIQQANAEILRLQEQQKKIALDIQEIQRNALKNALEKLIEVESRATSQVSELIRRYDELRQQLIRSYDDAVKLLGAGFVQERKVLEDEFRRRMDVLEANLAIELAEVGRQYINQSAQIVRESFPFVQEYIAQAVQAIVDDQTKALDKLINETKDFIQVVERQIELGAENAEELRNQAEQARVLLSALEKVKESYKIRAVAEFVKADIESLKDYLQAEDNKTKTILANLQAEMVARKASLADKELLLEREKFLSENASLADVLLLRRKYMNMREFLEREKQIQQERLDIEKSFEEQRIEIERQSLERRRQALQQRLDTLRQEIAAFGGDVPAQVLSVVNSLQNEIASLDFQIQNLNARSAEVAQSYLQNTAKLSLEYAKKYAEAARKEAEEILQATEAVLENINQIIKRRSDQRLEALDREKSLIDKTIDLLVARAEAGSLSAEESIAELIERKRNIEKQEQEIRRQQQRRELLLTALQAYSAAIQRGSQSPLADTVRDLTALSQLIQALPTFYEGTEYVSAENAIKIPKVAKDAFLARLHEGERVVPAHINEKLRNVPNEALPSLLDQKEVSFDFDSFRRAIVTVLRENNRKRYFFDRL